MGRFETEWLATDENLAALTELSGVWIDRVHGRKPPRTIVLDMDSSEIGGGQRTRGVNHVLIKKGRWNDHPAGLAGRPVRAHPCLERIKFNSNSKSNYVSIDV